MPTLQPGLIGIVGNHLKDDYFATCRTLADFGYKGIESAHPPGDPAEGRRKLADLGLTLLTVSASREALRDDLDGVVEKAEAHGVNRVSCWWGPAESKDQVLADAELYDTAGKRLADGGVRLAYHHHDHEFKSQFDGKSAFDLLVEHTDPAAVGFVVDLAWVAVGGRDPSEVIRSLGRRVTSLHVKDVIEPKRDEKSGKPPWTTVGTGVVPIVDPCRVAAENGVEWAVVEQDQPRVLTGFDSARASLLNLRELGVV